MKLLIDVGNTRAKYHLHPLLEDVPASLLTKQHLIDEHWLSEDKHRISHCLVSAVKESLIIKELENWCHNNHVELVMLKSDSAQHGLINGYTNPETLGVDRWLAMLGGMSLYPDCNLLVVDLGTASTIDIVLSGGKHSGGWICPGIELTAASIFSKAEKVYGQPDLLSEFDFGYNSSDGVNQGSIASAIGLIEVAFRHLSKKTKQQPTKILLTGGNAAHISPLLVVEHELIDNLVFIGMQRYC